MSRESGFQLTSEALLDLNWMNLSTRRQMQRCLFMHDFINDSERNSMITRVLDYHSHITRFKETIRTVMIKYKLGTAQIL